MTKTILNGYENIKILGAGAFGKVWKVKNKDGKFFAVKVIDITKMFPDEVEMIKKEIKLLGELSKSPYCNKSISCLYEAYETETEIKILMEYIPGKNLEDLISELDHQQIKDIFFQGSDTLNYLASRGVLHRDIKPENIMYNTKAKRLVFVDFGVSCTYGDNSLAPCEGTPGTKEYIDPSVVLGTVPYNDPRSDVYSFGATMYTLMTKSSPIVIRDKSQVEKNYATYRENLDTYKKKLSGELKYMAQYVEQMIIPHISERPTIFDVMSAFSYKRPTIKFVAVPIEVESTDKPKIYYQWDNIKETIDELYEEAKDFFIESNKEFTDDVWRHFTSIEKERNEKIPDQLRKKITKYLHNFTF